jgi:hypothetical protein
LNPLLRLHVRPFIPRKGLLWPLLTSPWQSRAIVCQLVPLQLQAELCLLRLPPGFPTVPHYLSHTVKTRTPWRPPWVRVAAFIPHPPHLLQHLLMAMGFALTRKLALMPQPSMRFVFLRSELCIRLPSDLTSR